MKKLMFALALVASMAATAEVKIGTVDMFMLVRNHRNYDTNKATVQQTEKDYERKMDAMRDALEDIQKEGTKLAEQLRNPMLAQGEKTRLEKQLMGIQQKFMAQQQKMAGEGRRAQQDIQSLESRLLKVTTDDLRTYVDKFAKANGYTLIVDKTVAAFSVPEIDVTNAILKEMGVTNPVKPGDDAKKDRKNEGK